MRLSRMAKRLREASLAKSSSDTAECLLDPIGPRHFFKPLPQFSIDDVPCPANLFVRRNVGSRFVGIRDEGDIKLRMKSFSQRQ